MMFRNDVSFEGSRSRGGWPGNPGPEYFEIDSLSLVIGSFKLFLIPDTHPKIPPLS